VILSFGALIKRKGAVGGDKRASDGASRKRKGYKRGDAERLTDLIGKNDRSAEALRS
jgi:hypothetical protein